MSTIISAVHTVFVSALHLPLLHAVRMLAGLSLLAALLLVFKPLLRGIARAMVLLVKPRRSNQEWLARRQMADAMMLNRMLNSMETSAPSHAAELRAMAARG